MELDSLSREELLALLRKVAGGQEAEEAPAPASKTPKPAGKTPADMDTDELTEYLVSRVKKRTDPAPGGGKRTTCYLNLRVVGFEALANQKPILRDPSDPQWPDEGATTHHEGTAKSWIRDKDRKVVTWVQRQLQGQSMELTVAAAVEPYIDWLHAHPDLGPTHKTTQQRRSYLRNHIASKELGPKRLATLKREDVQAFLNNLTVRKSKHGIAEEVPAEINTIRTVYAALKGLYSHHYKSDPYPFAGIRISRKSAEATRRREMRSKGRAKELIRKTTYSQTEILALLLVARYIDTHPELGFMADWACRNFAPLIALQLAFASRISEICEMRWDDIEEDEGFAFVAGVKTQASLRFMPLQRTAVPWVRELRATQRGIILPEHYLIRTHPDKDRPPVQDLYARRMGLVEEMAGLKIEGQRTHIFRRTHSSLARTKGISGEEIRLILGHASMFESSDDQGTATDVYVQAIREEFSAERYRTYLSIPSPEELDRILETAWVMPKPLAEEIARRQARKKRALERGGGRVLV